MSTVILITLAVITLLLWAVYKILKLIIRNLKKIIRNKRCARKQAKVERDMDRFEASIAKTNIISRRKVFDSNRKYHYETTFMIYFNDNSKSALTVQDGSYHYDFMLGKLED